MNPAPISEPPAWEHELAPKVSRNQMIFWFVLYLAWMTFLAYVAICRWFGSLQ